MMRLFLSLEKSMTYLDNLLLHHLGIINYGRFSYMEAYFLSFKHKT